jgi:hypothetical protein
MILTGETEVLGEKPVPGHCPPISHGLSEDLTRSSTEKNRLNTQVFCDVELCLWV